MEIIQLTPEAILALRGQLHDESRNLLGITYDTEPGGDVEWTGRGKWLDLTALPKTLDCSGLTNGVCSKVKLKMPHGSQSQYNFTIRTDSPQVGDLAFFAHGADPLKIYHVGMVYDDAYMVEARAHDPSASFETGKVILRPIDKWRGSPNFAGFRSHPKLILKEAA